MPACYATTTKLNSSNTGHIVHMGMYTCFSIGPFEKLCSRGNQERTILEVNKMLTAFFPKVFYFIFKYVYVGVGRHENMNAGDYGGQRRWMPWN